MRFCNNPTIKGSKILVLHMNSWMKIMYINNQRCVLLYVRKSCPEANQASAQNSKYIIFLLIIHEYNEYSLLFNELLSVFRGYFPFVALFGHGKRMDWAMFWSRMLPNYGSITFSCAEYISKWAWCLEQELKTQILTNAPGKRINRNLEFVIRTRTGQQIQQWLLWDPSSLRLRVCVLRASCACLLFASGFWCGCGLRCAGAACGNSCSSSVTRDGSLYGRFYKLASQDNSNSNLFSREKPQCPPVTP